MEARRKSTESDLIIDVFFTNVIRGKDGITPHIGSNGHWYLGSLDTGVIAKGVNGKDGKDGKDGNTPVIGENGNWWIGGVDTGKSSNASIPPGIITMWSGKISDIPNGWALCNGSGVLSNGSRIPDLRGRFIVGYDPSDDDYSSMGNKGGENFHTLSVDEMPYHSHLYSDDKDAVGKWNIPGYGTFPKVNDAYGVGSNAGASKSGDARIFYTSPSGESSPHENRPPYFVLAYIIKL